MLYKLYLGILFCAVGSYGLYDSSSDVVDLTPGNFDKLVTNSDQVWLVEFYAPWCGHCKNLVPEYKKAARALKGVAKVGAVNADEHKSFSQKYSVTGFPTIKIFTGSKNTPYQGQRNAEAFVDAALKAATEKAYASLGKKSGSSSSDKKKVYGHNIPWKKVQTTKMMSQLYQPHLTSPIDKSKLDKLQRKLFRRRIYIEDEPKLIKSRHFTYKQQSYKKKYYKSYKE